MNKKFVNVVAAHHVLQQSPVNNSVIELLGGKDWLGAGCKQAPSTRLI
jgi:hypothetical protein